MLRSRDTPKAPFSHAFASRISFSNPGYVYRRRERDRRRALEIMMRRNFFPQQNVVEPMQVDAPTEDNDNAEEEPYIVENPTLVCMHVYDSKSFVL